MPHDEEVNALIRDLLKASDEFRELWELPRRRGHAQLHEDGPAPGGRPARAGREVLMDSTGEQSLVLYTPQPGTDTAEKLELLRVLGREKFAESWNVR